MALDLVGQFAGISQRERRIDGQRHLRVEPMTEAPARDSTRRTPLACSARVAQRRWQASVKAFSEETRPPNSTAWR